MAASATGEPCASMPTASTVPSAPRPSVSREDRLGDVVHVVEVDHLDAAGGGQRQPLGHQVDADDPATGFSRPMRVVSWPTGPEPEDGQGVSRPDVGVLERLPGRGQDVGEVEVALVGHALGHLDRPELGLRHAQVLGLAARAPRRTATV